MIERLKIHSETWLRLEPGEMERWTDGQKDRYIDRSADNQKDKEIEKRETKIKTEYIT